MSESETYLGRGPLPCLDPDELYPGLYADFDPHELYPAGGK